jgi:hypothetical protein
MGSEQAHPRAVTYKVCSTRVSYISRQIFFMFPVAKNNNRCKELDIGIVEIGKLTNDIVNGMPGR